MKIFIHGSFVYALLKNAADLLGIELIHPPEGSLKDEVDYVNSFDDVLCYLYFSMWDDKFNNFSEELERLKCPKIFWNLEDPNHFHMFWRQAKSADIVLTSAIELFSDYRQIYPDKYINSLTWACDPFMHYPNEEDPEFLSREFDIVFMGNRYPKEQDRVIGEFCVLFPAIRWAQQHNKRVGIFGKGDNTHFSWRYAEEVWKDKNGNVPYADDNLQCEGPINPDYVGPYVGYTGAFESGNIYRKSIVVICLNEQLYSPTMTSMRTYEACACGNIVLSHFSLATQNIFGDVVSIANDPVETEEILSDIFESEEETPARFYKTLANKATVFVHQSQTYTHRLLKLLEFLGEFKG